MYSTSTTTFASQIAPRLRTAGLLMMRCGLVALLLLFGLQKWTKAEAEGIQLLVSHSPFMSWLYRVASIQGASISIGVVELAIAAMITARRWVPVIAAIGSAMGIVMFLITLSFLLTTPNIDAGTQGFLIKDIFLLAPAVWSTGESLAAHSRRPSR